jgi:hypothetical protein
VEDIAGANESPEFREARLANDAEWKRAVVVITSRVLRHQGDFELGRTVRIAQFGKPAGQGKNDSLDTADARGKEVRIDQQLHAFAVTGFLS